jgi:hypothetical protein
MSSSQNAPQNNKDIIRREFQMNGIKALSLLASVIPITTFSNIQLVHADDAPKKKKVKVLETSNYGIKYIDVKKGQGAFPNIGDFVVIDYIGIYY